MASDHETDTRDLAEYLNKHPEQAKQLMSSIGQMLEAYDATTVYLEGIARLWLETQQKIADAFESIQLPVELFRKVAKQLVTLFPSNWPRPLPDINQLKEVLEQDGIPVVHIPRAEIVRAIVDAAGYDARIVIIEDRADDIAQDCMEALDERYDAGDYEKQIPLVRSAIAAFQGGHFEAGQALAVSVCDTYLKSMFPPEPTAKQKLRKIHYSEMAERLSIEKADEDSMSWAFNIGYALAAATPFLVPWEPGRGVDPPTKLSRHVSIHFANTDHMTKLNATIAIMLATTMSVALNIPMRLMLQEEP